MQQSIPTTTDPGHVKFFRNRLLILSSDDIAKYVEELDQEADNIRSDGLRLAWYMRGGITYDQVMEMSVKERRMISDLAKENIETTKKTNMPWF